MPFHWRKPDKAPSRCPFSGESIIKPPLGCLSIGESEIKCPPGCPSSGENKIKWSLGCPSSGQNPDKWHEHDKGHPRELYATSCRFTESSSKFVEKQKTNLQQTFLPNWSIIMQLKTNLYTP